MVNAKTLVLVALGFVANGCHTSYELSEHRFMVTNDFTDAQFAVMQKEVDHLCDVNDGRCIVITRKMHHNRIVIGDLPKTAGNLFIDGDDDSRLMTLDAQVIERGHLRQIFRHEMGHAAGCVGPDRGNLPEPGNVMHSKLYVLTPDIDWTADDLDCINAAWDD